MPLKILDGRCCCNNGNCARYVKLIYVYKMYHGVRLSVDRDGVVWGHIEELIQTPVDLGPEGVRLQNEIDALYRAKRAALVYADQKERFTELCRGKGAWLSMCATLDVDPDLPAGFQYVTRPSRSLDRALVVFNKFTAVYMVDHDGNVHVAWETQDAETGWIGTYEWSTGRGHAIPAAECPVAKVLEQSGADTDKILGLLVFGSAGQTVFCTVYRNFGLREPYPSTEFSAGVDGTLKKDGVAIRGYGKPLVADCVLPKFFDPVRDNVEFWDAVQRACLTTCY